MNEEKTFVVEYWEHAAVFKRVKAKSREEAEAKLKQMVETGEVDFAKESEVGDYGYECLGEAEEQTK